MKWWLGFLSVLVCGIYIVYYLDRNYMIPEVREAEKRQMPRVCERKDK